MKRRRALLTNALLLVVALGAGAGAMLASRRVTPLDKDERKGFLLPVVGGASVTKIEIDVGESHHALVRSPVGWQGDAVEIDPSRVDRWLTALTQAKTVREAPESVLGAPEMRAKLSLSSQILALALGKENEDGGRYARVEGVGTYLVGREWAKEIYVGADGFRDHALFHEGWADLDDVQVAVGQRALHVVRIDPVSFREKDARLVPATLVEGLLETYGDLEAASFSAESGGDPPFEEKGHFSFVAKNGTRGRVRLGGPCSSGRTRFLRETPSPETRGCLDEAIVRRLFGLVESPRFETHLIQSRVDEIAEVTFDLGGVRFDAARSGSSFLLRAPTTRPLTRAEGEALEAFLRARQIELPKAVPPLLPRPPPRAFSVHTGGDPTRAREERIELFEDGKRHLARRVLDDTFFELAEAVSFPSFALR